jgi:hypothetical protein
MSDFRRKLAEFFDAENRRDWDDYREFLHPQIEWVLEEDVIKGRERYCETIVAAYAQSASRFRTHQMLESEDRRRIATLLVDTDGRRSLDIFEFEDGLIRREWEFLLGRGVDWNGRPLICGQGRGEVDEIPL